MPSILDYLYHLLLAPPADGIDLARLSEERMRRLYNYVYYKQAFALCILLLTLSELLLSVAAFASPTKCVSRCQYQALHLAPQQLGEFKPINLVVNGSNEGKQIDRSTRRVWLYDFVSDAQQDDTIPYHDAWDLQKRLMEQQLSRIGKRPKDPPLYDQFIPMDDNEEGIDSNSLKGCDSIIMLQHDPVYTLGTASDTSFIHDYDDNSDNESRIPIVRIERGGEVTYHGPGQLTVYPILDLRGYNQDIHWYMRALEEAILLAMEKAGVAGVSWNVLLASISSFCYKLL
jgi:lipoate-protein ligase B